MNGLFWGAILMVSCYSFADMPYLANQVEIEKWLLVDEESLQKKQQEVLGDFQAAIQEILCVKEEEKTFVNTAKAWDLSAGALQNFLSFCESMSLVHPHKDIRNTCQKIQSALRSDYYSSLSAHPDLYHSLKTVLEKKEALKSHEIYYVQTLLEEFEKTGMHLSEIQRQQVSLLQKEISDLALIFQKNIQEDRKTLAVSKEDLSGLPEDFISSLPKNEKGEYILSCDYPIYVPVMQYGTSFHTRKKLSHLFATRAYPQNEEILDQLIAKRSALAKLLGFQNYASLDLLGQMAATPEKVEDFLSKLCEGSLSKVTDEFTAMTKDLPSSVILTPEGKVQSYDVAFLAHYYKEKYYALDELKIAEYFPLEKVLDGLLSTYSTFFKLDMKRLSSSSLWDKDLYLVQIKKKDSSTVLGHVILDLFPRENKFTHACESTLSPAYKDFPALSLVVANFPYKTEDKPSLLSHDQVRTLFHEFGHAMHDILGRSDLFLFCGTKVKVDFVELPSQLLEEWIWEPLILQKISSHYKTGQPLPEDMIEKIIRTKYFNLAHWVQRQAFLSLLSLHTFTKQGYKESHQLMQEMRKKMMPNYLYAETDHFLLSFGHLSEYAAKYYGYLWSKVFAVDVFAKIKKEGILNENVGEFYRETILHKGGSEDPNALLKNFLGREPSQENFTQGL